jgi:hypothetical protein
MPWYRDDPAALNTAAREALVAQPHMRLYDEGDRVGLRGRFEIRENDELIEAFGIELVLPPDSALALPAVWEAGGRIPRVADPHHVNADGSLCVILPEAFWYRYPDGLSLSEYLNGPLRRHLSGQAMVLRGEKWPAGEWGHGFQGMFQFYEELFNARDGNQLLSFLNLVTRDCVKGHWMCPCGTGKKLRYCHGMEVYRVRERIPAALLEPIRLALKPNGKRAS